MIDAVFRFFARCKPAAVKTASVKTTAATAEATGWSVW
jgi:hypothetical protein